MAVMQTTPPVAQRSPTFPAALASRDHRPRPRQDILFQTYFKSAESRTYAAQVIRAASGNHGLVLTEGKRDKATNELRKTRVYIWSEDFASFFDMIRDLAEWARGHPAPPRSRRLAGGFARKPASSPGRSVPVPGRPDPVPGRPDPALGKPSAVPGGPVAQAARSTPEARFTPAARPSSRKP